MIKEKGGLERQNVVQQNLGTVQHLPNCDIDFANFALFAFYFVTLWFVALLNLLLLGYVLFLLVRTLA